LVALARCSLGELVKLVLVTSPWYYSFSKICRSWVTLCNILPVTAVNFPSAYKFIMILIVSLAQRILKSLELGNLGFHEARSQIYSRRSKGIEIRPV
jgi:hypothetical protein